MSAIRMTYTAKMTGNSVERLGYRPALDALRALAVVAVFLFHGAWLGGESGFAGVDLFFVLSGFLITRLLVEEFGATGSINLGSFFVRRALRLMPAVAFFLAAVVTTTLFVDLPSLENNLGSNVFSSLFYVRNYWDLYFGTADGSLGHMWSLSIEEQFYFVWPFAALFVLRRRGRSTLAKVSLGVAVLAAITTVVRLALGVTAFTLYRDTLSHGAVPLLAGAALGASPAALTWLKQRNLGPAALGVGLVGFVAFVFSGDHFWDNVATGYVPLTVVCLMLIAGGAVVDVPERAQNLLRPVVGLGRISYGFYLWHVPVMAVTRHLLGESVWWWDLTTSLLATLACTLVSWTLIERPAMRLKTRLAPRPGQSRPD